MKRFYIWLRDYFKRLYSRTDLKKEKPIEIQGDPTMQCPPAYANSERGRQVYAEAFRKCFEYLQGVQIKGDIVEFGTYKGFTARILAELIREFEYPASLHLFDSFEGFPEIASKEDLASHEVAANKAWQKGTMALPENIDQRIQSVLSKILSPSKIRIVKGFFENTVPELLPDKKIALAHIDCDLYGSARTVLDGLLKMDLLQDGCLLVMDDFNCNRANPLMGERKALSDAFEGQGRYQFSEFFSHGWHGRTFFVHDGQAADRLKGS